MRAVLFYFLQVVLTSGVLYGYYHFFLRNKRFHQYNRVYLLVSMALSLIIPLLRFDIYFNSQQEIPVVYQLLAEVRAGGKVHANVVSFFNWQNILSLMYGLGVLLFLVKLVFSLTQIVRLRMNHRAEKLADISFINTNEDGTPFSFFRWLFWNEKINIESQSGKTIFRHELFHIRHKHTWDIIYLEILTMLFWINPFFHLMKKETKAIHEFLADRFAIDQSNKWEYAELLMMRALQTQQRLVNPFFHNQIKRRIAMITNSSKSSYQYLRKIMVLPLTFIIVTVIAINCTSKDLKDVTNDNGKKKTEYLQEKLTELKKGIKDSSDKEVALHIKQLKEKVIADVTDKIFNEVEVSPSFVGGQSAWAKFLQKNINPNVPVDNGAPEGTYTVMTQFVVDKNGKISDLKTLTHFGYGMEEEVLRVMKLSPDWTPAMQKGEAVKAYRKQPITFSFTSQ